MRFDAFTVSVTTAGTRVQVSTLNENVKSIMFQARPANTGTYVYVGRSDVSSTDGWTHKKQTAPIAISFGEGSVLLSDFYVDADTNADKVEIFVITL